MFSKTVNGIEMNVWGLDPTIVTVSHIANVLARINRYGGHWVYPISVARHCLTLADELKRQGHPAMVQLQGLFHDASEAYTQDIPSPLKALLWVQPPGPNPKVLYEAFEFNLLSRIYTKLMIRWPIHPAVWTADKAAYELEIPIIRGEVRPHVVNDPEVVTNLFIWHAKALFRECGIPNQ